MNTMMSRLLWKEYRMLNDKSYFMYRNLTNDEIALLKAQACSAADWNGIERIEMICTQDGYVPDCGKYYFTESDNYFEPEREVKKGVFVYTDDNLYRVMEDGKLGTEMPTHEKGIESNGTAKLAYVCKLAKYELKYTYKNN